MWLLENKAGRRWHEDYYLTNVERKDWHLKINNQNVFDQPIIIQQHTKILKNCHDSTELIAIDLSK